MKMKERIRNLGKLIVVFVLGIILIVCCLILRAIISKEDLSEMNRKTLISRSNKHIDVILK